MSSFKVRDLVQIKESLSQLLNSRLSVKTSYRIVKFSKRVIKELDDVEKARIEYINANGVKNAKGEMEVPPEKVAEFREQMDEVLDEVVDIPVMKVNVGELEGSALTVGDIANLDFLIQEGEETNGAHA